MQDQSVLSLQPSSSHIASLAEGNICSETDFTQEKVIFI